MSFIEWLILIPSSFILSFLCGAITFLVYSFAVDIYNYIFKTKYLNGDERIHGWYASSTTLFLCFWLWFFVSGEWKL